MSQSADTHIDKRNAMKLSTFANRLAQVVLGTAAFGVYIAANAEIQWPNTPLGATTSAPPLTMLVMSKDHTMFTEAYNDASDVDGDGTLDIRFKPPTSDPKKPGIIYTGLFDPHLCYTHNGTQFNIDSKADQYTKCPGKWSGNWLNYVTTSRIDALRVVLYGGYRKTDTNSQTILERAYIPQDGHSWAKEYTSKEVDDYEISDFTPLSQPETEKIKGKVVSKRHFFGNLTNAKASDSAGTSCITLSTCSSKAPILRIAQNAVSGMRVWDWASAGRHWNNPGQNTMLFSGNYSSSKTNWSNWNKAITDHTVRVEACKAVGVYRSPNCKGYPAGNPSVYKPTGLLHDYTESMRFGLLTGSFNKPMAGGVLRKVVSSFDGEVDTITGVFTNEARIVKTIDNLRIRDFNNTKTTNHYRLGESSNIINPAYELSPPLADWGNPVGEMMYETLRYLAGKKGATSEFSASDGYDGDVGLTAATWDDPYKSDSQAKADWCARPNMLVVSGINPSYDSDQLPGSSFSGSITDDLGGGDRAALNVATIASRITDEENIASQYFFLGQTTTDNYDGAPTPKLLTSLATVRGLSEEPSKRGSYYAASVANYGKTNDLRPDLVRAEPDENPVTVDTYAVALSSPLPQIEVPFGDDRKITLVPFGKSYGVHAGAGNANINPAKGREQPTATIVDFYVDYLIENASGELDEAKFRVNFEDVEQGNDYDMDVIVEYTIKRNSKGGLDVTVTRIADESGPLMSLGYVISGTAEDDGTYLVVGNEKTTNNNNTDNAYYLNVPELSGNKPNQVEREHCKTITNDNRSDCDSLPVTSTRSFTPGASQGATILKDPLWYAAKHGGFLDIDGNGRPNLQAEWDRDGDGTPDSYFLVQNPTKLRESLKRAFDNILERAGSGASSIAANSTGLSTETFVYQGLFNSDKWSGDLVAYQAAENGVAALPTWKASEKIPAASDRNIFYGSRSSTGVLSGKGFTWGNLTDEEEAMLDNSEDILNYLRGVRTKETLSGGTLRDRDSKTVLGDISHSSPLYVKDSETVFVGANDGMLHAFDAMNGNERFAYIPSGVFSNLKYITQPAFNQSHKFYVDGDMVASTKAQTGGKNYLVATLGRGGKGLFGLDVTDPDNFNGGSSGNWGWEYFPSEVEDPNLGHMLGRPVIAGNRVIVGNGYNSVNGTAVLYVFDIATGAVIHKIDTGVGGDNGLATPGLESSSSHIAYAGDLKGNVWKFDINAGTFSRLFTAIDEDNNPQPITAPIHVSREDSTSRLWVHFGTGSDFRTSDPTNTAKQSWYGLVDAGSIIARSDLFKGAGFDQTQPDTLAGRAVRVFNKVEVEELSASEVLQLTKGWVIDLPEAGERMVTSSKVYTPTAHKVPEPVLVASSVIPVDDPCQPGGRGYLNAVNPYTGGRLEKAFFDVNNDGKIDAADAFLVDGETVGPGSIDLGIGKPSEPVLIGNRLVVGGSEGKVRDILINTTTPAAKTGGRISWREIVR